MKLNTMRLILFFLNSYLNIYKLTIILLNHHIYYHPSKDHLKKIIVVFDDKVIIQKLI